MYVHLPVLLNDNKMVYFFSSLFLSSAAGSVPPLYREIYDIISPSQERVDKELFLSIFAKSNLPNETITQVTNIYLSTPHSVISLFVVLSLL